MPPNPWIVPELITPCSLNTAKLLTSISRVGHISPQWPPLPAKQLKVSLFHFTPNCLPLNTWHGWTEAKFHQHLLCFFVLFLYISTHHICYNITSVYVSFFFFFVSEACGSLAPWPGIKPGSSELEDEVLTTGPPGKSQKHLPWKTCLDIYISPSSTLIATRLVTFLSVPTFQFS